MKYLILPLLLFIVACTSVEELRDPFDFFWTEMDKKYVYFEEKGIDWDAVYTAYKPRTQTGNENDLLQVFQEIIDMLKDGHVAVSTPDTTIFYDWERKIDEVLVLDLHRYTPSQQVFIDDLYKVVQLKNDIVYIGFFTFSPSFDYKKFQNILANYSCSRGVIVDVRANVGGFFRNVGELAACFFTQQHIVLYEKHKTGHGRTDFSGYFPITMAGRNIIEDKIPVVVLVGCSTYSGANDFAAIMKSLPNVTLMGTRTGGGGATRADLIMPNGWILSYSQAPMYDIHYNSLEAGVEPHYIIPTTAADVEEMRQTGIHKLMEAAYQHLNKNE
jgi:C-terminal processing protease CtpA/Prc